MSKNQLNPVVTELCEAELMQVQGGMPYTWGMLLRSLPGLAKEVGSAVKDVGNAVSGALHKVASFLSPFF